MGDMGEDPFVSMGALKNRSSIGHFNDGSKDNPSISREIFGVRLKKRRRAVLGDPPQGLFQQSHRWLVSKAPQRPGDGIKARRPSWYPRVLMVKVI
jgi:hypothetical protein